MSCEETRTLFSNHVDGVLGPEDEDRLGGHIAECAACRQALALYEQPLAALGGLAPEPTPALRARILSEARREGLLASGPPRWARRLLPLAAGLLVVLGGLTLLRRPEHPTAADGLSSEACLRPLVGLAHVDPMALYAPVPRVDATDTLPIASRRLTIPAVLRTSGPYAVATAKTSDCGGALRVPLVSPYGDALMLSIGPAARAAAAYQVERSTRHVFETRVLWEADGVTWSLEGRVAAEELLDLADELRRGARPAKL